MCGLPLPGMLFSTNRGSGREAHRELGRPGRQQGAHDPPPLHKAGPPSHRGEPTRHLGKSLGGAVGCDARGGRRVPAPQLSPGTGHSASRSPGAGARAEGHVAAGVLTVGLSIHWRPQRPPGGLAQRGGNVNSIPGSPVVPDHHTNACRRGPAAKTSDHRRARCPGGAQGPVAGPGVPGKRKHHRITESDIEGLAMATPHSRQKQTGRHAPRLPEP